MKSTIAFAVIPALLFATCASAVEMPPEAKELNCNTCHAIDRKILGPAWQDIAKRYKGQTTYKYSSHGSDAPDAKEYPLVDGLVMKISKGGSGNWGSQPMLANNALGSKSDKIRHLVEFILNLDK